MRPDKLNFHKLSQELTVTFDGVAYRLPAEFLRVHSPSAEVRGHGGQGGELPVGKQNVQILNMQYVGNYALKLIFSDGHDSGLYDWDYLLHLGRNKDALWESYLEKLKTMGASRIPLFLQAKHIE